MSNYPPDEPVIPATPIYDEAIATTPGGVETSATGGSTTSQAADQAKQTAGQAADTVKQTAGDVKDQAGQVASTAKDAGQHVAETTKDQAQQVAADTMSQARNLYGQATSELSSQAAKQQDRLTQTIRTFGQDLSKMASGERVDSGPASELVQNLAGRAHTVAEWFESRSPEQVLSDVRQYAARRPGVFLAAAAVTGVVAARLTKALRSGSGSTGHRGLPQGSSGAQSASGQQAYGGTYVGEGVGETYVTPEPYTAPQPYGTPEPLATEYTTGRSTGYLPPEGTDGVYDDAYGSEELLENEYGTGTEPGTGNRGGLR